MLNRIEAGYGANVPPFVRQERARTLVNGHHPDEEQKDQILSAEQAFIDLLPNHGLQYGLLEIPTSYSDEFLTALLTFHTQLNHADINSDSSYLNHVEKQGCNLLIDKEVDSQSGLRLQVGSIGAFSKKLIAAWSHTQTAAYDAKDTLGDAPTTRRNDQIPTGDRARKTKQEVNEFERRLLAEMIIGWKPSDVLVSLSVEKDGALTIIAGGSIKSGTTSRPLVDIIKNDTATISTFQALRISDARVQQLEREFPDLLNTPEDQISSASRLFNLSAIKGMESRLEDLGILEFKPHITSVCMAALSLLRESNQEHQLPEPAYAMFDTHLRGLFKSCKEAFDSKLLAGAADMSLFPSFVAQQTVHEHHYRYWLEERRTIAIGFSSFDTFVDRSAGIMANMGIDRI